MFVTKNAAMAESKFIQFINSINFELPASYKELMRNNDGIEIVPDIESEASCLLLWSAEQVAELNKLYETNEFIPDFLFIGSDGGGEGYAIKKGSENIFQIPFVTMDEEDAIIVASSFDEFMSSFFL